MLVDGAIRFVASHTTAPKQQKKANSDERVTVDKGILNKHSGMGN
jgi:hypothetical protein